MRVFFDDGAYINKCLYSAGSHLDLGLVILGKMVTLVLSLMACMKDFTFMFVRAHAEPVRFLRQHDDFGPGLCRTNRQDMFKLLVPP